MGYYTVYKLDISSDEEHIITEFIERYDLSYVLCSDGSSNDSGKWYDHEENLLEFSREYPHIVFTLNGLGESAPDIWVKYFKNGKIQRAPAHITFDDFDEARLI